MKVYRVPLTVDYIMITVRAPVYLKQNFFATGKSNHSFLCASPDVSINVLYLDKRKLLARRSAEGCMVEALGNFEIDSKDR